MADLIKICLFFYSFKLILDEKSIIGIIFFTIILIFYSIKYFRMKTYLEKNFLTNKKSLDKQKEFFIETMTHDFKIPTLAQLRGLELLRNETLGEINSAQIDLIKNIENSCRYLLEMIDMFSDAFVLEKNKYKLNYEHFNFLDLIQLCFKQLSEKAKQKNISFSCNSTDKNLIIEADKKEITRVMLNLLSCAINYSSQNSRIDITLLSNGKYLNLNIMGMDLIKNNALNIKNNRYTTIGETLGIYISKKIIELHNGKLSLSDAIQNKISFVIPQGKTSTY